MTFQPSKKQRELELVSMMLTDRRLLHQEFKLRTGDNPQMVFDRDMVRQILSREYPSEGHDDWHPQHPR